MKNKNNNLIDALKEYNKSLSEQINRIKSFIDEIDRQLAQHKKSDNQPKPNTIDTSFSREYLIKKAKQNSN